MRLVKRFYGWPEDAKFLVPDGVREHFRSGIGRRGRDLRTQWSKLFSEYSQKFPDLAERLSQMQHHGLPAGWDKNLPTFPADAKGIATRESSGKVLNSLAQNIPWLIGGSADLATSNKTTLKFEGAGDFQADTPAGRNLHFGVREHVMGASVKWAECFRHSGIRRDIFQLQRLHAGQHPIVSADGVSVDLHFYARFDWRRRRWADPSADRATSIVAGHAEFNRASSGRCE